jgi:hypothetical protein
MLPQPTSSFTIPSVHDGQLLECRLYHPLQRNKPVRDAKSTSKGAIVAHPYAPLGGCYDDAVVMAVVKELIGQGFVVGTFNFR